MRAIPLAAVPNQAFSVTLDGGRWALAVKAVEGGMVCDVALDGEILLSGSRALAGETVIPYRYLEQGNFLFLTEGDALPWWADFGVSQALIYLNSAEMAAIRANRLSVGEISTFEVSYLTSDEGFYLTTDAGERLTND